MNQNLRDEFVVENLEILWECKVHTSKNYFVKHFFFFFVKENLVCHGNTHETIFIFINILTKTPK